MRISGRPFGTREDLQRVAQFLTRTRAASGHCGCYHLGDLSWNLFLAQLRGEVSEDLSLWEAPSGELLGFAWFYPPNTVDIQTAPWRSDREALEATMMEWALARCREHAGQDGRQARLYVPAFEEDGRFLSFLERYGFRRETGHKMHMLWDLARPIPDHVLPEGYEIRPVSEDDLPKRPELQKAVWPWSLMTAEAYPALRDMPGYDPELDLVGAAPDGTFASFAICWLDTANGVREFEPVGTHPEHRSKGLGKAILWEALRRLRERNATAALVYPTGGDVPAESLYRSAGFQFLQRQFDHSRPVH